MQGLPELLTKQNFGFNNLLWTALIDKFSCRSSSAFKVMHIECLEFTKEIYEFNPSCPNSGRRGKKNLLRHHKAKKCENKNSNVNFLFNTIFWLRGLNCVRNYKKKKILLTIKTKFTKNSNQEYSMIAIR